MIKILEDWFAAWWYKGGVGNYLQVTPDLLTMCLLLYCSLLDKCKHFPCGIWSYTHIVKPLADPSWLHSLSLTFLIVILWLQFFTWARLRMELSVWDVEGKTRGKLAAQEETSNNRSLKVHMPWGSTVWVWLDLRTYTFWSCSPIANTESQQQRMNSDDRKDEGVRKLCHSTFLAMD